MSLQEAPAIWGAMRARHGQDTATAPGFARMISTCLDNGVDWVDHADIYDDGAVEALHGQALQHLTASERGRLRVISKCGVRFASPGQPGVRLHHYRSDAAWLHQQVDASLARLGVEQIDLYLLHRPDYLMQVEETAGALADLIESGKIAACGVSNFSVHQVDAVTESGRVHPIANQVEVSPFHADALDNGQLDQARRRAMVLLAWSPLGGSRLFVGDDAASRRLRTCLEAMRTRYSGAPDIDSLVLAWLRRMGVTPILGTASIERLQRQVSELAAIEMDVHDWYEILEAARGIRVP